MTTPTTPTPATPATPATGRDVNREEVGRAGAESTGVDREGWAVEGLDGGLVPADEWDLNETAEPVRAPDPEPRFAAVETWVQEWLAPIVRRHAVNQRRSGDTIAWCEEWWRHAEAIDRLEACWRAWEVARLEGGRGIGDWWLHTMDPMWAVLTSAEHGPFAECWRGQHSDPPVLPIKAAPPGWWAPPGAKDPP